MNIRHYYIFIFISAISLVSCSKKIHPVISETPAVINTATDTTNAITKKVIVKRKIKDPIPKIISVNDAIAKKMINGRLYYDLDGHRYWRNNKDGKYYLFNKAMYDQAEFKPN